MDLVRCIHFADLHLGVEAGGRTNPATGLNQRIDDVCERLDELCACVEDEAVDAVLFAGDAFKNQSPTPTLQRLFAERVRRLARSGAAVFLLIGNHDLPKMAALSHPFSIYDALEVSGVVVGDRAGVYRLELPGSDGADAGATAAAGRGSVGRPPVLQVAALPHFSRTNVLAKVAEDVEDVDAFIEAQLTRTVRALAEDVDPDLPAVFVGHCHVNQAEVGSAQSLFGIADVEVSLSTLASTSAFAYYALGHVHRRQVLSTDPFVAYSGSLERVDFGEGEVVRVGADGAVERRGAEDKGFYRFDLTRAAVGWTVAGEPAFRTVASRPFVTVRTGIELGDEPTETLCDRLSTARRAGVDFEGAFVKVAVDIDASDRTRLRQATVRASLPEAYDVRIALTATGEVQRVRDPRFAKPMGELEALERYLETQDAWTDDREELLELGAQLIREVVGR